MKESEGKSFSAKLEVSWLGWIFIPLAGGLLVWQSVCERSAHDLLIYPLYVAASITVSVYLVGLLRWWKNGLGRLAAEDFWLIAITPIVFYLFSIFLYAIGASIFDVIRWVVSPTASTTIVAALTLGTGAALFALRLCFRSIYGLSEMLVGVLIACYRFASDAKATSDPNFYIAMLTAGVYLVVRGLDNVHQGLVKEPKDPAASRLVDYFSRFVPAKFSVEVSGVRAPFLGSASPKRSVRSGTNTWRAKRTEDPKCEADEAQKD